MKRIIPAAGGLLLALSSVSFVLAQSQVYVYPTAGQSEAKQSQDQFECQNWAVQQAGDPSDLPEQSSSTQGTAARSAARGAAGGAAIGAIAGDAGKGAAIGATAGGMRGVRQKRLTEQQEKQQQQQAQQDNYNRAYAACLEARGYSVR